jgi:hypothetical protein
MLVDDCAMYMNGRIRDSDSFKALLAHVRYKVQVYNLPPGLVSTSSFACACIGFVQNVAFENSAMHSILKPMLPALTIHADALALKFKRVWNWKKVVAVVVAAASIAGGSYALAHAAIPIIGPVVGAAILATTAVAAIAGIALSKSKIADADPFCRYRIDRASNPPSTRVVMMQPTTLPSTPPPRSVDELLALPKDFTAKVKVTDPTATRDVPPLHPLAIVSTINPPIVPENSAASGIASIMTRVVKPQAYNKMTFSDEMFDEFVAWIDTWFEQLFPGILKSPVVATAFSKWSGRFPPNQAQQLEKCWTAFKAGNVNFDTASKRSTFIKVEPLSKSTVDGVHDLDPRNIASGTNVHAVATGPYCHSFSDRLADIWDGSGLGCYPPGGGPCGPVYATGYLQDEIGAKVLGFAESVPDYAVLEIDYNRFDASIHERLLQLEADIFRRCGCEPHVYRALIAAIEKMGADKYGNKYCVIGTRNSGDHQTSCGNTMIQGLLNMFCHARHAGFLHKLDHIPSPAYALLHFPYLMLMLGDDNFMLCSEKFLTDYPVYEMNIQLGLDAEPVLHTGPGCIHRATFCSARFYPSGGKLYLAPCLIRVMTRAGFYVNPPNNVTKRGLVRGDAIGSLQRCSVLPFARDMYERCIQLTSDVPDSELHVQKSRRFNFQNSGWPMPDDSTFAMIEEVYGLTRANHAEYMALLSQVSHLPAVVDYAPFGSRLHIDGLRKLPYCDDEPDHCTVYCSQSNAPHPSADSHYSPARLLCTDPKKFAAYLELRMLYHRSRRTQLLCSFCNSRYCSCLRAHKPPPPPKASFLALCGL